MAKKEKKSGKTKVTEVSTKEAQQEENKKKEKQLVTKKKVEKKKTKATKTTVAPKVVEKKGNPLEVIAKFLWSVKEKHMADVLHDLMTEKEIKEFAERVEILRQLQKWVTQRVIAKNLGISVTTVSRWSKVLQTGKERIKKYL